MTRQVVIRPTSPEGDREARAEVVRRSWEVAYRDIFSRAEIGRVFDGSLSLAGDWTKRRSAPAGTLVAELAGEVVGVSNLALLEPGVGELAALYVLPQHQGHGVGSRLWDATLAALGARGCTRMEVWTLTRADAWRFYAARGCTRLGDSVLWVGEHSEPVAGYELRLRAPLRPDLPRPLRVGSPPPG
ncbi:MAG: hypothetical protein NVSMB29_13800 [Candidatus Dormibacteria bacterium]